MDPRPRLDASIHAALDARLGAADAALARQYPGEAGTRQPVHTVYLPGDRFSATTVRDWGDAALAALDRHGSSAFETAFGVVPDLADEIETRVRTKLAREPIEDLRLDFEDGYGAPADQVEDDDAVAAGTLLAGAVRDGGAPAFVGLRCKSLEAATRRRGVRTLDLFLAALLAGGGPAGGGAADGGPAEGGQSGRGLPDGFVITLPKVTSVDQVEAMTLICEQLERAHALPAGVLRFEVQVETPQCVLGPDGTALVARMVHAAPGRVVGLHYGTYDYSAALGVAAAYQSLDHPAADHAKAVMQLAAAGTGVRLSDGSTNVLPVGDTSAVRSGWQLHARLVRRSLERGFYQGWDMHPAHLPSRYAATYAFFADGAPAACRRLNDYVTRSASGVLDEPATAAAMAGFLRRGLHCGALDAGFVKQACGLDVGGLDALVDRRQP